MEIEMNIVALNIRVYHKMRERGAATFLQNIRFDDFFGSRFRRVLVG